MTTRSLPLKYALRAVNPGHVKTKGEVAQEAEDGLLPGYSASGQDVWLRPAEAQFRGDGLILSAVGARCGKVFVADSAQWGVVANTTVLVPQEGFDSRYLWYLVNDEHFWEKGGAAQPYIRVQETLKRGLPFPDLDEQRRIADFLDAETRRIDSLVTLGNRQAALMAEKRDSLAFATVTRGLNATAQMTTVEDAWFRLMPKHWRLVAFRHLALRANAGEVIDKSWWGDGDELLFTCSRDPVTSDFHDFPVGKRAGENDILVTRNATPYVHLPPIGSIYSNVVQRVTLPTHLNRRWARYSLETASSSIHGYGVSIDTLNYGTWKALRLPVPPPQEQEEIARFLDDQGCSVAANILSLRRRGALLAERKLALIAAAVTGQLDVTSARRAA